MMPRAVIRGWGATLLLRSVPHVPCVRIMRPFAQRVEWLMKQLDTDDTELFRFFELELTLRIFETTTTFESGCLFCLNSFFCCDTTLVCSCH